MGIPNIIIVGKKSSENIVEFKDRSTNEKVEMESLNAIEEVCKKVNEIK